MPSHRGCVSRRSGGSGATFPVLTASKLKKEEGHFEPNCGQNWQLETIGLHPTRHLRGFCTSTAAKQATLGNEFS